MRIAVVGGGIIGLSVAWRLASRGHQLSVFDANAESREASWAAAGMLAPHNEANEKSPLWELCCDSLNLWPQFIAELGSTPEALDYRSNGSLVPILENDDRDQIDQKMQWLHAANINAEVWDHARIRRCEPQLGEHIQTAVHMPGAQVNPRIVCRILRERCAALGVSLSYRRPIQKIAGPLLTCVDGSEEQFDHIVIAAGAWTPQLAQICGLELQGEAVKGQMIAFDTDIQLNHFIHCAHAYCVPRMGTGLVVGASMEYVGFDRQDNQAAIASLMAGAQRLLPGLRGARIAETWTGLRPRLNGGMPLFARIDDRLSICSGHFRNGILLTPISAEIMCNLVVNDCSHDRIADLNLEPFSGKEVVS